MKEIEPKLRLAEIPKLIALEAKELDRISREIERLNAEHEHRMQSVLDMQKEELALLKLADTQP